MEIPKAASLSLTTYHVASLQVVEYSLKCQSHRRVNGIIMVDGDVIHRSPERIQMEEHLQQRIEIARCAQILDADHASRAFGVVRGWSPVTISECAPNKHLNNEHKSRT